MPADRALEVADNALAERFEITVDGRLAGFAGYRTDGRTVTMTHTEINDSFEGQGLGSRLIRAALDDLRQRGAVVVPICPFVRAYIERHQEYLDLVPAEQRKELGLPG